MGATRISLISVICISVPCGPSNSPLLKTRHTVTGGEFEAVRAAGDAFCSPEPTGLVPLLQSGSCAYLFWAGLCYVTCNSSRRCTTAFREQSARSLNSLDPACLNPGDLFPAAQRLEESIWMGATTFRQYLQGLAKARQLLLRPEASGFEITPVGQLALAEKRGPCARQRNKLLAGRRTSA